MSPQGSTPIRVFLCHSRADKPRVHDLHRDLAADGFAPWLDEVDLLPGQHWRVEIGKAVRAADFVVVCLSTASTTRAGYVNKEIKDALDIADEQPEGTIFLIPARLEECVVPDRLSHVQWVDLFTAAGYPRLTRTMSDFGARPDRAQLKQSRVISIPIRDEPSTDPTSPSFDFSGFVTSVDPPAQPSVQARVLNDDQSVGRNDPCWCGSGKRFKKCHGGD